MIRRLVAGLIVVGLAVGIWVLWPRDDSDTTTTTLPAAVDSTTSTSPPSTTSIPTVASTTTSTSDFHVVTTVEEAETILRELWFGWFEGIYNQDEDRIKEVVGTQAMVDAGKEAFDDLAFHEQPTREAIVFDELAILRSDSSCLALWVVGNAPFVDSPTPSTESVDVIRRTGDRWVLVSSWQHQTDLWEADCDAQLEP